MTENINPIPSGYHSINTYLPLTDAAKGILFDKNAFGAKEKLRCDLPPVFSYK